MYAHSTLFQRVSHNFQLHMAGQQVFKFMAPVAVWQIVQGLRATLTVVERGSPTWIYTLECLDVRCHRQDIERQLRVGTVDRRLDSSMSMVNPGSNGHVSATPHPKPGCPLCCPLLSWAVTWPESCSHTWWGGAVPKSTGTVRCACQSQNVTHVTLKDTKQEEAAVGSLVPAFSVCSSGTTAVGPKGPSQSDACWILGSGA